MPLIKAVLKHIQDTFDFDGKFTPADFAEEYQNYVLKNDTGTSLHSKRANKFK